MSESAYMTNEADPVSLHEPWLIERARETTREKPDVRLVAFVMDANAPETISVLISSAEIHRAEDKSISLTVTRESAKELLLKWSPAQLEWLGDSKPGSLPVIHFAKRGLRTRTITYDAAY